MAVKMLFVLVCTATCLSLSSASNIRGHNSLAAGMQPDVVARTLNMVQNEWKAQVAIFADCDTTSKLPGSPIVNCKDAHNSFDKSCSTIVGAIVQGSGGDKAVTNEYMGDVCSQSAMSGWHQAHCHGLALAVINSMSADKYQNRVSFNSDKMCNGLWSRLLKERAEEAAKEKVEREAAEKKAAEEEKLEIEAQKKEADRKKALEAERQKQEAATKAAEAKAKVAEAAAKAEEKKAEAKAMAAAAKQKMDEAEAAEKVRLETAKKAETKAPQVIKETSKKAKVAVKPETVAAKESIKAASKPEAVIAKQPVKEIAKPKAAVAPATEKVVEKVAKSTAIAPKVDVVKLAISAAAPAPAAAGGPGAAGAPGGAVENLNDPMPLKAAEQGFAGKKVKHADGKTAAADWQNEYATK